MNEMTRYNYWGTRNNLKLHKFPVILIMRFKRWPPVA